MSNRSRFLREVLTAGFLILFLVELVRTAWIGDDAAITLRTVLNWQNGFGLRFNIDERVQAYTHPLWFLLLGGASQVFGNIFTATFALSIGLSATGLYLLSRLALKNSGLVLSIGVLAMSKAYIDYSTSGLENPLAHVLLIAIFMLALSCMDSSVSARRIFTFFFLCGLLYLVRPDLLLLVAPLAMGIMWQYRRSLPTLGKGILAGALPVFCWTTFSLYYYGFPFPNTAYAKLGSGIEFSALLHQGEAYFLNSFRTDPLTLFGIILGCLLAYWQGMLARMLALGVLLYLGYIFYIGGDFMAGRFFTAPLLASAIIIARHAWLPAGAWVTGFVVLGLGTLTLDGTLLSDRNYKNHAFDNAGIADERGYYYKEYGLLTAEKEKFAQPDWKVGEERVVRQIGGGLGYSSIFSGPATHWVDVCALADPLLSRLPAKYDPKWRVGHFIRQLPTDYMESIRQNSNLLLDPQTRVFYDVIRHITRGDLNDPKRWQAILKMNLGAIPIPDWDMYRNQHVKRSSDRWPETIPVEQLSRLIEGVSWDAPGMTPFDSTVYVQLPSATRIRAIDISVDHDDVYEVYAKQADRYELLATIKPQPDPGVSRHLLMIERSDLLPTNQLMIKAREGDQLYSLGHLIVK